MKTIFITAYNTFISRNLFNTNVLKLLKADAALRIIIFCPPHKVDLFTELYGDRNIIFEGLDMEPIIRLPFNKKLYRLSFLLENSQYVKDQRLERYWNNKNFAGHFNFLFVTSLSFLLSTIPVFHRLFRIFDFKFSDCNFLKPYFDKYKPDFLFVSDIFGEIDAWFMKGSKKWNTPVIGMVRSWDNTTTKGLLRLIPERIIVNSSTIKNELIRFHDCISDNIFIAGLPQFDSWLAGPTESREAFFSRIGADPQKSLILFAPAGAILSDTDWQLCEMLNEAVKSNRFIKPVQFLVRNHPQHPADLSKFSTNSNFIIETPGFMTKKGDNKNIELKPEDNDHLRNSIYYSDIVMYIATSLGLDSLVYNKPQILISFDGWEKKPYIQSVRRYNKEDCLDNFLKSGGAKLVETKEDWINYINEYLRDPSLDQRGRHQAVIDHMYKLDGRAGERIGNFIMDYINHRVV